LFSSKPSRNRFIKNQAMCSNNFGLILSFSSGSKLSSFKNSIGSKVIIKFIPQPL